MENNRIFGNTLLLAVAVLAGTVACNIYSLKRGAMVVKPVKDDLAKPTGKRKEYDKTVEPDLGLPPEPEPEPPVQPTQQAATGEGKSNVKRNKYVTRAEIEKSNQKKREIRAMIKSKTDILKTLPRRLEHQDQARALRNEIALHKAHLNLV